MQHLITVAAWVVFAVGVLGGLPDEPLWTGVFFVATAIICLQAIVLTGIGVALVWHFLYGTTK